MHSSATTPHGEAPKRDSRSPQRIPPALVLCREGEVAWASAGLAELLGHEDAPTYMGRPLMHLLSESAIDQPAETEISNTKLGQQQEKVVLIAGRDDKPNRVVSACCIDGSGNDPLYGQEIWLLSDVTPSADAETSSETSVDARVELENARKEFSQDRDELIALLSHELRTPLTVISGYSKLLLSGRAGALTDEQSRFLEESRKSCQRLNYFVTDLLDASHDHAASFRISVQDARIEDSIRGVIEFFLPLFEERDVTVEVEIKGDLPAAQFDPTRIEQVLTNLIGNAVKYTKVGSAIEIQATAVRTDDGEMIEVAVTDDGPGIARADIDRIFEPYVRGSEDRRGAGIGLGLAICRRILEAHGGEIGVEMVPGRGSRFIFTVPVLETVARVGC